MDTSDQNSSRLAGAHYQNVLLEVSKLQYVDKWSMLISSLELLRFQKKDVPSKLAGKRWTLLFQDLSQRQECIVQQC